MNYEKTIIFKIAEAIISIIIIGIIFFTVISSLIKDVQKRIFVSQLRYTISVVEQSLEAAKFKDETSLITDTKLWRKCNIKNVDTTACTKELKQYFTNLEIIQTNKSEKNYINNPKDCEKIVGKGNKWWFLNDNKQCCGWNNLSFYFLNDVKADIIVVNGDYLAGQLTLDINGDNPPNTWGRDTFFFNITPDGSLVPYGSETDCKIYSDYTGEDINDVLSQRYWKTSCSKSTKYNGMSCAARIIENGWKMDY